MSTAPEVLNLKSFVVGAAPTIEATFGYGPQAVTVKYLRSSPELEALIEAAQAPYGYDFESGRNWRRRVIQAAEDFAIAFANTTKEEAPNGDA